MISTFGCGEVFSPALVPGTANVLIAMEKAEVLRPGFLDLLEPGGPCSWPIPASCRTA